ncbi:MAG: uroporphyrinogen-III synthase [Hyphomonadaceae bacterium]
MSLRALVTRAEPEAQETAARIRARGHAAFVAPLLRIKDRAGDVRLESAQALLFTSANGVRAFARQSEERGLPVYCVGDATAAAARAAGFAKVKSADGDAGALVALAVHALDPRAGALLHMSGADLASDIAAELRALGFRAERRIVYEAAAAGALPASAAALLAADPPGLDLVFFHSPRAARIAASLISSTAARGLDAACLSPAVAEAASLLPWRRIIVAPAPREDALLDASLPQTGAKA